MDTYNNEVTGSRLIPNFGENNVVVLKDTLFAAFKCEMKIMPNKHVHFAPKKSDLITMLNNEEGITLDGNAISKKIVTVD